MSSPATPDVTVVIPTRDRVSILGVALRSALSQQGVALEVVVVDDGSTDGTAQRLEALGDVRVRVVRHERSQGVARARNDGIAAARAPWVAFLDDDDAWGPDKLRRQLDELSSGGRFSYTGVVRVEEDRGAVQPITAAAADTVREALRTHNAIDTPSSLVAATTLLRELGGFDEDLSILADWELYLRLAEASEAAVVEEPRVAYRLHAGNLHAARSAQLLNELERIRQKHPELDADELWYWEWAARAMRRSGAHWQASRLMLRIAVRTRRPSDVLRALAYALGDAAVRRLGGLRGAATSAPAPAWIEPLRLQWADAGDA